MDWYFVGVDFGQSRDYTTIAVLERKEFAGEFDYAMRAPRREVALHLRYLERIPLGTSYPEVVRRVTTLTHQPLLANRCHLAVDATGVGKAIVDELRRARPAAILQPVTITGGQWESVGEGSYRVPKRDLIIGLQVLLQNGGLQIARGLDYAGVLVEEMMAVEVRVTPSGHEQFAAWREGTHDDLVFAVALAYWSSKKAYPNGPEGDARWWSNPYQEDTERVFQRLMEVERRRLSQNVKT